MSETVGRITLMCGFPASGKTTFLKESATSSMVILCPDEYRIALTGRNFFKAAEDAVWSAVKLTARVMAGTQRRHVIIDATHLTEASRAQWIRLGDELGVFVSCNYMTAEWERCCKRNLARTPRVPDDVMERMRLSYVEPSQKEGFCTVTPVYPRARSKGICA